MSEQPVARDDSAIEPLPPLELPREPDDDAHEAVDHESHDPYQPL